MTVIGGVIGTVLGFVLVYKSALLFNRCIKIYDYSHHLPYPVDH